jgi:hypothetical protein
VAMQSTLVPRGTRVEANGAGAAFDISGSPTRTFLCTLTIDDQIEQESIDLSVWGSADGENWGQMPLLRLPQQFYRGQATLVLDVSLRPEVKLIHAKWELNRWGRVAPLPMFVIGVEVAEIPAMPKRPAPQPAAVHS